jgi:Tfp pilus assembly protein PilE
MDDLEDPLGGGTMRLGDLRQENRGLTMIELVIGTIVVALLIGAAIPVCSKYARNARLAEARLKMNEIVTAAKAYALENRDAAGNPTWPSTGSGIVDLRSTELFTYSIASGGGANANTTPFTIIAKGILGKKMARATVSMTVASIDARSGESVVTGL